MRLRIVLLFGIWLILSASCKNETNGEPEREPQLAFNTIVTGYEIIWGMDFLPNGDLIFGEKRGRLYRKSGDNITEITGFPEVFDAGQGGLLDVRVHPDYMENGWVYTSYSATNPLGGSQFRLVRYKINNDKVQNLETLFVSNGKNTWYGHYGSRILFAPDRTIYFSIGEGGSTTLGGPKTNNKNAQDAKSDWGKIHRITEDGGIPKDNPVIGDNENATTVYSYGHRNPQGLALHPKTGDIWSSEHGPRGGDELNIIKKGTNYGWPFYSDGINYNGTNIPNGHYEPGFTPPLYTWIPSIGTCGLTFVTGKKFHNWNGNLLVGGLASHKLYRCVIDKDEVVAEYEVTGIKGRVRNVIQGPDENIYVSLENPGRIVKIEAE